MYLGHMVEDADTDTLFSNPLHPYTKALLSAIPVPNPQVKREKSVLKGEIPSPLNPPTGCVFHTRCPFTMDICRKEIPANKEASPKHFVACHLV